jgi:hypothetical protein
MLSSVIYTSSTDSAVNERLEFSDNEAMLLSPGQLSEIFTRVQNLANRELLLAVIPAATRFAQEFSYLFPLR